MDVPHGSAATAVDIKTTGDHHRRDGDDASMGSADAVALDASTDDERDTATAVAPFAVQVAPASGQELDDSGSGGGGPRGCPRPGTDVCAPCHRGFTPLQRLYAVLALNQVAEAGWGWFVYLFAFVRGAHGPVALTLFYCALSGTALLTAVGMGTQQHHRTPDLAQSRGRRGRGLSGHLVLAGASACKAACIVLVLAAAADDGTGAPPSGSLPLLLVSGMVYGVCLGAFWCTYHGLFLTVTAAAQPQQQHRPPFHEPSTSVASTAPSASSSAPPVHAAAAAPPSAVGTVFALAGLCGALAPVLAGALLDLCDGVYTPLFLIAASVALTNAVGLVRLSQRPDTVPVCYGPGLDTLTRGRALLPMLIAEGLCASVVQFVPILVSLRLAALTDRGLYFGAFQGGLSALAGAGALVATPRRTGRPLTVACALACAGLLASAYAAGGAYPDSVTLWSVACGTMTLTYGWLSTLTGTRVVQFATAQELTAVQAMWLREVVFGGARCLVGLLALVEQIGGPGGGADLSALFVGAACCVVVLWMCWQRHIRAATLARAVAHLQQQQQQQQQQQPPRAGDGDAAVAPTV